MADKSQNSATAPAPTPGSPASTGIPSTAATTTEAAPLQSPATDPLDFEAQLAADLAGPEVPDGQTEKTGTPPAEETDPLQRELDEDEATEGEPPTEQESTPEAETPSEDEEPETPSDEDQPAEEEPEPTPRGMEGWPKQAIKRIQNQSEQIRALKAQVAQDGIKLPATESRPLDDVAKLDELESRYEHAQRVLAWCEANPDGGEIKLANGATYTVSPEEARSRREAAQRAIKQYPDRKLYLAERERDKPWEAAEALAPDLLKPGTQENTFFTNVLKAVPELAQRLPDYEVFMAAAARGMRQLMEERSGKAKWVRYELKDGKIVPPKQPTAAGKAKAAAPASAGKPAAAPQATPFRPTNQRPPTAAAGARPSANLDELTARAANGDESAVRALLRAELEAA